MLQNLLDALDNEDDEFGGNFGEVRIEMQAEIQDIDDQDGNDNDDDNDVMLEVLVEEVEEGEGENDNDEQPPAFDEVPAQPNQQDQEAPEAQEAQDAQNEANANAPPAADAEPAQQNHEAPPAPARRMGLGAILSNVSNMIVSALILPGVSFAAGEALKLVLPKDWTRSAMRNPWTRSGVMASGARPGLLQQQWGRSLVGGCVYIVLRDMIRVYAKSRKVAAMANRRVKNVDRPRRGKKASE